MSKIKLVLAAAAICGGLTMSAATVDAGGGLTTMEATTATRTLRGHTGAIGTGAAIIGDNVGAELNYSAPISKTFCLSGAS